MTRTGREPGPNLVRGGPADPASATPTANPYLVKRLKDCSSKTVPCNGTYSNFCERVFTKTNVVIELRS